ncbi:putative manganese efflux pump MntP [Clostridiales bacterium]|nr:putative manganese efflux pump MntP [Clostridiales bacterium]
MDFLSLFMIALGLAMDAFAVSIANGISVKNFKRLHAFKQGSMFGLFQAAMTSMGWLLGSGLKEFEKFDHWIAFILLGLLGITMIRDGLCDSEDAGEYELTFWRLCVQAVATSIDALAVGVSLALLSINIMYAAVVIGVVAFVLSVLGGAAGKLMGGTVGNKAEVFGGAVLLIMGIKILAEHLLNF